MDLVITLTPDDEAALLHEYKSVSKMDDALPHLRAAIEGQILEPIRRRHLDARRQELINMAESLAPADLAQVVALVKQKAGR